MRKVPAILLAVLLVGTAMPAAPVDAVAVKERVSRISPGSLVTIRLAGKGKVRGRIGAVDDTGFAVGVVRRGKVEATKIGFGEVESIRSPSKSPHNGLLLAGIVVGAVLLVGVISFARRSSSYK